MTIEQRLTEALHQVDDFEPSPDLFARFEVSLEEDRRARLRRWAVALVALVVIGLTAAWVWTSADVDRLGRVSIDGWRLTLAYLVIAGSLLVGLGPHIRRFGRSFIDDVFHLSPETGGRFLTVLDIAYYVTFAGLILVDADMWSLGESVSLAEGLEGIADRLGLLLFAMGVLHAVNIAFAPVLGLIFNSIVRADLRRGAGTAAPPESMRARAADANARAFALGVAVIALCLVITALVGGPGADLIGFFE